MKTRTTIAERLENQVEVDADKVAGELLDAVVENSTLTLVDDDAIRAGVAGAIEEIDESVYVDAVAYMEERVAAEVETQAKQIALRLMREMAANTRREAAAVG